MAIECIHSQVVGIISEQSGVRESDIKRESDFKEDLNCESLDLVELVMSLEDRFDIEIPNEDADRIQTVGECIDYIVKKKEEK